MSGIPQNSHSVVETGEEGARTVDIIGTAFGAFREFAEYRVMHCLLKRNSSSGLIF